MEKQLIFTKIAGRIIYGPPSVTRKKKAEGLIDYSIPESDYLEYLKEEDIQIGLLVRVSAVIPFWGYIDNRLVDKRSTGQNLLIGVDPGYLYRIEVIRKIKPDWEILPNEWYCPSN